MTGPEHYKMAEQLIEEYTEGDSADDQVLTVAHVHATLAVAAATAGIDGVAFGGWSRLGSDQEGWRPLIAPAGVVGA